MFRRQTLTVIFWSVYSQFRATSPQTNATPKSIDSKSLAQARVRCWRWQICYDCFYPGPTSDETITWNRTYLHNLRNVQNRVPLDKPLDDAGASTDWEAFWSSKGCCLDAPSTSKKILICRKPLGWDKMLYSNHGSRWEPRTFRSDCARHHDGLSPCSCIWCLIKHNVPRDIKPRSALLTAFINMTSRKPVC